MASAPQLVREARTPLTLARISEAVIFAAREAEDSHIAEVQFAQKLKRHPEIMKARLGRIEYVCGLLGVQPGHVLLDVGSGVGLNSVLALLCGVSEVHSVEMTHDRLNSARLILQFLRIEDRVHLHGQDVLNLNLPARAIDAVFSFELLEHIADIGALYRQLACWLKPGARVFGRTGGNGRNLIYRRTFKKIWDRIDKEHYMSVREETILDVVPHLPDADLKLLVELTRGELIDQVRRTAKQYERTGMMPSRRTPRSPRDPLTGQYMERLLDPNETVAIMNAQGFRTALLRPNFDNITTVNCIASSGIKTIGEVIRLAHPASLFFAPWLEFLSQRKPSSSPQRRIEGIQAQPQPWSFLRSIREREIELVTKFIRPGASVLEIGAGAGWQARYLAGLGFDVIAIDLASNPYASAAVWPVIPFDGTNIPLPDASVDAIFSSNVLEHVPNVEALQCELLRVLKPDGIGLHLMPTPSWRFWTTLAMYPTTLKKTWQKLFSKARSSVNDTGEVVREDKSPARRSTAGWWRHLRGNLWPVRHGERGNALTEMYYFSARHWKKLFKSSGWELEWVRPNGLFYTGQHLLGEQLALPARSRLSRLLGSACFLYALRPDPKKHTPTYHAKSLAAEQFMSSRVH